jgi:hypothetical protein
VGGVRLPPEGPHFFTWDPRLRRSPSPPWRRYGTDRLVRTVSRVAGAFARAHPDAARIGIGDLSRPHGGPFGSRFGGLGHFSHRNGLDVDVYYPRRDGRELEPLRPAQIDRRLAQDLLDRFLDAGAELVYVGPRTGLTGPRGAVRIAARHDNHMHVRLPPHPFPRTRTLLIGRSVLGRPITVTEHGNPEADRKFLVVGCIHGGECAGTAVVRRLRAAPAPASIDLWLVPDLNPDGRAARTRQNARGVDLNRNFPAGWRPEGARFSPEYPGPWPLSEPETRLAEALLARVQPSITIWLHQPQALVRGVGEERAARPPLRPPRRRPLQGDPLARGHGPAMAEHRSPAGLLRGGAASRPARARAGLALEQLVDQRPAADDVVPEILGCRLTAIEWLDVELRAPLESRFELGLGQPPLLVEGQRTVAPAAMAIQIQVAAPNDPLAAPPPLAALDARSS